MKSGWFIFGFSLPTLLFICANVWSYLSEKQAYYGLLEETGMVWAGAWSWGVPFGMVIAGLGNDNHSQLEPYGLAWNVLAWLIVAGLAGAGCDVLARRARNREE